MSVPSTFKTEHRPCTSPGQHSRADLVDGAQVSHPENMSRRYLDLVLPLICHVVAWTRERTPPPTPHQLWQVGKPTLRSQEREALPLASCSTQQNGFLHLF